MKNKLLIGLVLAAGLASAVYVAHASTVYLNSPSACAGGWTMCSNAYGSDDNYAITTSAVGTWGNYNFSIPSNAASISVEIGVEGHLTKVGAHCPNNAFKFRVSKNGGTSYGPEHALDLGCPTDTTTWVDVTTDFGTSWVNTDFNNGNFVVKASCSYDWGCFLDWLPAKVTTNP